MAGSVRSEDVAAFGTQALVEKWSLSGIASLDAFRSNASYPSTPNVRFYTSTLDLGGYGDNYFLRIRGTITPPESGDYQLFIACDDQGEFWFSTDESTANLTKIAWLDTYTSKNKWTANATQKSAVLHLEAGKKYYFEAFLREASSSDFIQLAWARNGGTPAIIGGSAVALFNSGDVTPPATPGCPTVFPISTQAVRLNWGKTTDDSGVYEYRVYRNGELVSKQFTTVLAICVADNLGAQYTVSAVDIFGNESAPSLAAVIKDPSALPANGLLGRYFSDTTFTTQVFQRIDPAIDFNWAENAPESTMPANAFSVRWEGQIVPKYSEEYTFTTTTDDGVRLIVNNKTIIDKWTIQNKTWTGKITLVAGTRYNFRMDYYDNTSTAQAKLMWKSANQPEEVIPTSAFIPQRVTTDAVSLNNTWTGQGVNNLWSNPANWSLGVVPLQTHKVTFSGKYSSECFIDMDVDVQAIVTADSYSKTIYCLGKTIRVAGDYNLSGVVNGFDANVNLILSGSGDQNVYFPSNQNLATLNVLNIGGQVCFRTNLNTTTFTIAPGARVGFAPDKNIYAGVIDWQGTAAQPIRMGLCESGNPWYLRLTKGGIQKVSNVEVAFSNAKYSDPILGTEGCRDYGNNTNWVFSMESAIEVDETAVAGVVTVEGVANGTDRSEISVYVNGVEVPVTLTGTAGWSADVTLADGATNTIEVKSGDAVVYVKEISYTAPAVTGSEITIRLQNSQLLKAIGGLNANIGMQIDTDGDTLVDSAAFTGDLFNRKFEQAGAYTMAAKIDRNKDGDFDDESEFDQTLTVRVVEVNWNGPVACQQGFERAKNDVEVNGVPLTEVTFTTTNPVSCIIERTGGVANHPSLAIKPMELGAVMLQARIGGEKGSIIAECPLEVFRLYTTATSEMPVIETIGDDTVLTEGKLIQFPWIPDLIVKVRIFVWGATFDDSTVDRSFYTNSFAPMQDKLAPGAESYGTAYRFLVTRARIASHGPCHTIGVYQNGVLVGQ